MYTTKPCDATKTCDDTTFCCADNHGMAETIGARVERLAKEKKGWTLAQLAAALSVSYETLRKWVKGDTAPNRRRVEHLSKLLESSPDYIVFGVGGGATIVQVKTTSKAAGVVEITETDWGHLLAYKDMSEEDIAFIAAETQRRHEAYKRIREEVLGKAGIKVGEAHGQQLPIASPGTVIVKVVPGNPREPVEAPKVRAGHKERKSGDFNLAAPAKKTSKGRTGT